MIITTILSFHSQSLRVETYVVDYQVCIAHPVDFHQKVDCIVIDDINNYESMGVIKTQSKRPPFHLDVEMLAMD